MIKNIILDIGNVLGHFCWEDIFHEKLGVYGKDFDEMAAATTGSGMWNEFDRSLLSDEEIIEACCKRAPQHADKIREFFSYVGEIVIDYDYSEDWIKSLKARGYKVYILSNYGRTSFNKCLENGHLQFINLADGRLVSYEVCMCKPEAGIYEAFLKKFKLNASECVFIDDRPENIAGGEKAGIKGIVFTGYEQAQRELEKVLLEA